ncbi:upstream stimulatory factor 1 isoform X1 [Folsomia candida]|uniref:upstream stimulatory factor 1 isoform X1 n=1 Tax=Folsomia candida TaxID=158441 RepID=UPI000B8F81E1|nr:upstream stimulatory factor 1 isoform X1 [Folsomia candida]
MDIAHHHVHQEVPVKVMIDTSDDDDSHEEIEIDPMEIATTVTIVEEDGSTSVVEGAQVSSVVSDAGPNSAIRFGHSSNGNVTYQVVANDNYHQSSGLQLLNNGSGGGGQYYVVSSGVPRSQVIDPRNFGRVVKANARDDKKRATHNEVERRRRDKINGWIGKLAKIVPSCADEAVSKNQSKGGILAKTCEYIGELKSTNCRLAASLKEHQNTAEELDALRREVSELRKENMMLKQHLGPTEDDSTVIITTSE